MRKVLPIFVGSASALLIAASAAAQTTSSQGSMNSPNGYHETTQNSGRSRSQDTSYQKPRASNDASSALSHLNQARDELSAMSSSSRRDKALNDVNSAIDETRALSSTPGHAAH